MKDEMKVVDTNRLWPENIHYQLRIINGIKGFEDLTHFLVGDFNNGEYVPFNVVKFGTQSIIMTPSFCEFMLENLSLTKNQRGAVEKYMDILNRLSPRVYKKLLASLEDYINPQARPANIIESQHKTRITEQ